MKIQLTLAMGTCALLGACATESFPNKRPITKAEIEQMTQTDVAIAQNDDGVGKSWFMTDSSSAGAQYGLIGALVSVTMDAIMNAAPAHRAQRGADEVGEVVTTDKLNASLRAQFEAARAAAAPPVLVGAATAPSATGAAIIPASADATVVAGTTPVVAPVLTTQPAAPKVTFGAVRTIEKILAPGAVNDAVEVAVSYTLSEDASALRVVASAAYENSTLKYSSPYQFKKEPPKSELSGPVYRNTFVYESDRLPLPVLTPELKQRLIAAAQKTYADASGQPPVEGTEDFKKLTKEVAEANDDTLSKSEASIFMVREWVKDGGGPLAKEIEKSHAFIAKYVLADLNDLAVPDMAGTDRVIETMPDGRTVRLVGTGVAAGQYTSSPGQVSGFTSYGNAISISKANSEKVKTLRAQAKVAVQPK